MQVDYTDEIKKNLAKLARRFRHIYEDVQPVIDQLTAGETPGDQLSGVGYPTYKVRIKNSDISKGKSSGYRLLYYLQTAERVVLVTIYSKSDQHDIRADKLRQLIKEHLTDQDTENHHPK